MSSQGKTIKGKAPVAAELPPHGYAIVKPVRGSDIPMEITFVLTRDEIYVPIIIRKPKGNGPFPVITMGRGDGKGGVPHLEQQIDLLASMQDEMIKRGYVVVYVNYRNEIPHLYEKTPRAENLPDDVSGGVRRTLKSAPTLDSDDFLAILKYLRTLPYVNADAIGATGVSHSGEMILKAAVETDFAAGRRDRRRVARIPRASTPAPPRRARAPRSSIRTSRWSGKTPTRRRR